MPREADCAALYVDDPSSFARKEPEERTFGIPGAGSAPLTGPLFVGLVSQVARRCLEQRVSKGVPSFQGMLEALAGKLSGKEPALNGMAEEEGVAAIARTLASSGWETGRAAETAALLWNAGTAVGERLAASG